MSDVVHVGTGTLGAGKRCFVIAEVGVNHNGDPRIAHQLIDVAAQTGADAVKFQTFDPSALVTREAGTAPYQERTTGASSQHAMLEALVLPSAVWSELSDHASERGLVFLSTAFDLPSADLLVQLGVPALKVPSGELDNTPFIAALAQHGLPLLVSTGMGTGDEVAAALTAAAAAPAVALFHCVSAYPAPARECNLRAVPAMKQRFGVPVGWSDHTEGHDSAVAAVALGADLLEKHITLDRSLPGPDHAASSDPEQFAGYVAAVRSTEAALGDGEKQPVPSEEQNRRHARRSLHAARALRVGSPLTAGDVTALRPAVGLSPGTSLHGLTLTRDVAAGQPITADDVVPAQ